MRCNDGNHNYFLLMKNLIQAKFHILHIPLSAKKSMYQIPSFMMNHLKFGAVVREREKNYNVARTGGVPSEGAHKKPSVPPVNTDVQFVGVCEHTIGRAKEGFGNVSLPPNWFIEGHFRLLVSQARWHGFAFGHHLGHLKTDSEELKQGMDWENSWQFSLLNTSWGKHSRANTFFVFGISKVVNFFVAAHLWLFCS